MEYKTINRQPKMKEENNNRDIVSVIQGNQNKKQSTEKERLKEENNNSVSRCKGLSTPSTGHGWTGGKHCEKDERGDSSSLSLSEREIRINVAKETVLRWFLRWFM